MSKKYVVADFRVTRRVAALHAWLQSMQPFGLARVVTPKAWQESSPE